MTRVDIDAMFTASKEAIEKFAKKHQNETFYAFSIDAGMLCLNSEEEFRKRLKDYQEKYPDSYSDDNKINDLRYNTGDWEYQGFFELDSFYDIEFYSEHYHIPFEHPNLDEDQLDTLFKSTPYHKAMSSLLDKLMESQIFDLLNTTSDFKAFLSEHNY